MRRLPPDYGLALGIGVVSLILYVRTAAPSVVALFDDSLEFQLVLPTLGIAHPTGYPLYTLLGYLFTRWPLGSPAYKANLFSAVAGAMAVGALYLAGRELSGRRLAAMIAALYVAVIPVWWSQTTVAEVYALHGLIQVLLVWVTLRWAHGVGSLWPVGLLLGLGLAHHRMILLLVPAVMWWSLARRPLLQMIRVAWRPTLRVAIAPLLLYLYLPIRGRAITSLDGTYRNDWSGFWDWVTARSYTVFLAENPLDVHRDAGFYLDFVRDQLGYWGLGLALLGLLALIAGWLGPNRRQTRWDGVGLALALATTYGFGATYQVTDVEVFFIPAFLTTGLALAAGVATLQTAWDRICLGRGWSKARSAGHVALALLLLAGVFRTAEARFPEMDRSQRWEVHDLGVDMLSQPLPEGSVIVGILGEMTLCHYMQFAYQMRLDVQCVPADREPDRFAAVERALKEGRAVFLTRQLPGAEQRYSLGAVGPLIRVWRKGEATWDPLPGRADRLMAQGVRLTGYLVEMKVLRSGRLVRLTLHWRVEAPIGEPLKVSARLATPADDKVAMRDDVPVHNAYPATAWLAGETVQDVYDIRVPPSVPAGTYEVLVILYRASDGSELGRASLGEVRLPPP
ncbi:MAG TPA: DUF2723 domain-containing protein [Caldilineae bacterium]|nr:DUF2723 domain-containing protein [Caldilineae bacterium]